MYKNVVVSVTKAMRYRDVPKVFGHCDFFFVNEVHFWHYKKYGSVGRFTVFGTYVFKSKLDHLLFSKGEKWYDKLFNVKYLPLFHYFKAIYQILKHICVLVKIVANASFKK
jgi:hypothetical protein